MEVVETATFEKIIESLIINENVIFKSQQRDESDLSIEDKRKIASDLFEKSKSGFLARYGRYLNITELNLFKQFQSENDDITLLLNTYEQILKNAPIYLRNRRFGALRHLLEGRSYFTENEMMKRNPLLYEQLVGKYLTEDEKKLRDTPDYERTMLTILMEGIDREEAEMRRKKQEMEEQAQMDEDEDEDEKTPNREVSMEEEGPPPCRNLWGEYLDDKPQPTKRKFPTETEPESTITFHERRVLRDEFFSAMCESFLEGKDEDFDYTTVDNNEEYDNWLIQVQDAEEKYFDSEQPEEAADSGTKTNDSSEDELDIYMSALNNHPAIVQLSNDIQKL